MPIALLITIPLGIWLQSSRIFEREPHTQQIAMQVVSVIKLTRATLLHSGPSRRHFLLPDLVQNEDIRIYPHEKEGEHREPHTSPYLMQLVQREIHNRLGANAVIATAINDIPGVWVSLQIEGDDYWVAINPGRFEHVLGLQWLWWSMAALVLLVLGAVFTTPCVNQPPKWSVDTARVISAGESSKALPEGSDTEVAQVSYNFNQMTRGLKQPEADRAVMLTGISHGLRTPLMRLRLEIETSPVSERTRELVVADIEQMDAIIGQFLDYTRPSGKTLEGVDLTKLVYDMAPVYSTYDNINLTLKLASEATARCNRMETQRILGNLIENTCRYGKTPDTNRAEITVNTFLQGGEAVLCVADHGVGTPTDQFALLARLFYRLESTRSEAKGTGLGISIVNRILQRSGGRLVFEDHAPPEAKLLISTCYACA